MARGVKRTAIIQEIHVIEVSSSFINEALPLSVKEILRRPSGNMAEHVEDDPLPLHLLCKYPGLVLS